MIIDSETFRGANSLDDFSKFFTKLLTSTLKVRIIKYENEIFKYILEFWNKDNLLDTYTVVNGFPKFWKKKKIVTNTYEPWITE